MQNSKVSKRKQTALRLLSYTAMTISVIVISLICILLILGYRFDSKNGSIEQGGLFQFRSFPTNAAITLNNETLNFRTPGKFNADVGSHDVVMKLNGYQEWRKSTSIKAGELKWLNYARMIPTSITSTPIATHATVTDTLPSPDRRWFALLADSVIPEVTLYDLRNPATPRATTLTLPVDSYTSVEGVPHIFTLEEWDFGGRYMLIKHQLGETVEYIKVDRTDLNQATNITRMFNLPFVDMHFSGTSGNVFYTLSGTDIREADLVAKTITQPLVTDVNQFELYKSNIISYVASREEKRIVGVYINDKETIVRTYDANTPLYVDISSYFDNEYLAIGSNKQVEIIKDPLENADTAGRSFATYATESPVAWLEFASSGRFVVAGNGGMYSTYDIETDEIFAAQFEGIREISRPLGWLDDYYLYSDTTSSLKISEFDGTNRHDIVAVAPGFSATLSDDGEYLYSIGKTGAGYTFQSSKMVNN